MSFAIIETGGKQYKVSASKILEIEKLNAKIGETIKFQNVLLLNDDKTTEIGSPSIEGATVEAKLLDNVKDRTILIFHKRRRKHSRKKNGHRQRHSKIQITKIYSKNGKLIAAAGTPVKAEKSTTKKANLTKDIKKDTSIKKKVLKK
jgi:large subunit ribosomal protein L21